MRVLVTDGDQRAALALVRSLGRAGRAVYVCETRTRSVAAASRHTRDAAAVPSPLDRPDEFVDVLAGLVERWEIDVLLPVAEPSILAVLGGRDRLAGVMVPLPDLDTFRRICDKRALLEAAAALDIAVPAQIVLERPDRVDALPGALGTGPVVVKPSRSVAEADGRRVKLGVEYAGSAGELRSRLEALPRAAFPVLVQQRVIGPGIGIFLLVWDGELRAVFAHRRIREKPPSGGVSVYRESIAAEPRLVERSRALLDRFDWTGVAMVEYKVHAATGTPYLMEVNGRFWGSLQLAIDAGVDFPELLIEAALGESAGAPPPYSTAVRSRWWWGDVDQLLTRLRHSERKLALPPDAPSRLRALLDFSILWRPGDRNEIFRWSDPAPIVRESIDWITRR